MSISIPYYVVKKGITPGVYRTWNDCNDQIKDYPSPSYKKFDNVIEAYKFLASYDNIELQPQETIQNEKSKEKETFKEKLKNKQKLQRSMILNMNKLDCNT
jgi:ribonuclease HI